jgi:hypothetical protein
MQAAAEADKAEAEAKAAQKSAKSAPKSRSGSSRSSGQDDSMLEQVVKSRAFKNAMNTAAREIVKGIFKRR